jgi:feruloyl-CoA synthase
MTYAEVHTAVLRLAQALIDRGLSPERPIAILSGNDIEHALLALAAMHVGVPYASISQPYSLVSTDFGKLKYILGQFGPALAFCANGARFATAIAAAVPPSCELVVSESAPPGRAATAFSALLARAPTEAVERAFERVGPDTIAKLLFTSGSTGMPKGVINTQRMLCANQQMIVQTLPLFAATPPVVVDWLPWSHTFGGNHNFGIVLRNGGSFYINDGAPTPALFERTVENLRDVAPTVHFDVPRAYDLLVGHLRRDATLRRNFFSRLQLLFYAGAALPQHLREALDGLAIETCGQRIAMITSFGATETAPYSLVVNWDQDHAANLGLPAPGLEFKLAPVGDKFEARVRGPNVMPGYWRQPELSRAAFDEEGFYRMGDALRFADPADPQAGLVFDGRIAEDFKLSTGTWVTVGTLRARVVAEGAPLVQDVVVAGHNKDDVTVLIFPQLDACAALAAGAPGQPTGATLGHPAVRAAFQKLLDRLAREGTGSATRVMRAIVLDTPPAIDRHEITDKGSLNQRAVLDSRAELVAELYRRPYSPRVIVAAAEGDDGR